MWETEVYLNFCFDFDRSDQYVKRQINPFPHTTILQQTTLNSFCQKMENLYNWMDNLWLIVENIVAKGEIAGFQKAVCCRGVRKRLYEGKR